MMPIFVHATDNSLFICLPTLLLITFGGEGQSYQLRICQECAPSCLVLGNVLAISELTRQQLPNQATT